MSWLDTLDRVEALEDIPVDRDLVAGLERVPDAQPRINFYTPTFKYFQTSELAGCGKSAWPAVSITGGDCKLQCDHCRAKILEPMIPARCASELWTTVNGLIENGAKGMLLTGGSNQRNEVEYGPYYSTIRRIKNAFPAFRIAVHTALVDDDGALSMEQAGIDAAMMDVIGAQDTISQVYHLRRQVDAFEATLETLVATNMKVVPHIVIGLHYGRMLGEWNALEIVGRHLPGALVLVVVMPFYAPEKRPFVTPSPTAIGRFFQDARRALPDTPLLLGCARPPGMDKVLIDTYALMAGVNGIAHPSDGLVELAARLGRSVKVTPACCSIAVGEEVMALEDSDSVELDLPAIVAHERGARAETNNLAGIPVVAASAFARR